MRNDEFLTLVAKDNAATPDKHLLHPGADEIAFLDWSRRHDGLHLPADLHAFWKKTNGMNIKREKVRGEYIHQGALQFYPIEKIHLAGNEMYGTPNHDIPQSWVAIGRDCDCTFFVIYDCAEKKYLEISPIVPHETDKVLAQNFNTLLDWIARYLFQY